MDSPLDLDHNEVSFETNSTHSHDDEEFGELFERWKKPLLTPKEVRTVVSREARDEVENENGKIFLSLLLTAVLLTSLPIGEKRVIG